MTASDDSDRLGSVLKPTYPIRTGRLELRPFLGSDLDALADIHGRPEVVRYLYTDVRSRDEVRDMIEERTGHVAIEKEGDRLTLAIDVVETGEMIGDVGMWWLSRAHRQGEIGFVLHPDHHGQGYASEAAYGMLRLGFDEMELHRIIGRCDGRNLASARLMERLGMRREAHYHQNELVKGEWCDEFVFAMLRAEWADRVAQPVPEGVAWR